MLFTSSVSSFIAILCIFFPVKIPCQTLVEGSTPQDPRLNFLPDLMEISLIFMTTLKERGKIPIPNHFWERGWVKPSLPPAVGQLVQWPSRRSSWTCPESLLPSETHLE